MKISVIGLGYVGSVAAAGLASVGHDVLGIDIDAEKVAAYQSGNLPIYEPDLADLMEAGRRAGLLRFATSDEVSEPLGDVVIVAAGTPPKESGGADLSQVKACLSWIMERQTGLEAVLVKSTVPPGTGAKLHETVLAGSSIEYVANPEFLREGYAVHDWFNPDRIVIGGGEKSQTLLHELYVGMSAPYVFTDITSAEMIKYTANAFLATKISFINEIAALCDRLGATIDDVCEGISLDPRIGASALKAGVGYGGSCFPKDVRALDEVALTNDHNFELLRSVITVNNRQKYLPFYALRQRFGTISDLTVGVLGLAFKPNTGDIREAPAVSLIQQLIDDGACVRAFDPKATDAARKALPDNVTFTKSTMECADGCDAIILMTEWEEIVNADWKSVAARMNEARFMFDGRNALDPASMRKLAFEYHGIGRPSKVPKVNSAAPSLSGQHS